MKIRNGFVSNSSTASFLVKYREYSQEEKGYVIVPRLPKTTAKKLEKFGFRKANFYTAIQVSGNREDEAYTVKEDDSYNYVYENMCNEEEPINFLLDNKIPFEASLQYDQYYMKYDGKNKIIIATNYGITLGMYGDRMYDTEKKRKFYGFYDMPPFKQLTVAQYKKRGMYQ